MSTETATSTKEKPAASANWLALQQTQKFKQAKKAAAKTTTATTTTTTKTTSEKPPKKRRKVVIEGDQEEASSAPAAKLASTSKQRIKPIPTPSTSALGGTSSTKAKEKEKEKGKEKGKGKNIVRDIKNGESISALQNMVLGLPVFTENEMQPGKYLAIDCEMVGIGIEGSESSLARVSVVNFHGATQLDEFVSQRETVVDYRTQWSGIRPEDMVHAKPFEEVQKRVAKLIGDNILIGHAVHNDLKVLLLSHPHKRTRDTQVYASKFKLVRTRFVGLRNLVRQELGIVIQNGEHSSVIDARAAMAVYRLHRRNWERGLSMPPLPRAAAPKKTKKGVKPKKEGDGAASETKVDIEADDSDDGESIAAPSKGKRKRKMAKGEGESGKGGRKGVSSGLTTVVIRGGEKEVMGKTVGGGEESEPKPKKKWWRELLGF